MLMPMTATGERTGRPTGGDGSNKQRILDAARAEFAANGFRTATMRSIAARAGFDVALLAHYFGNKDGLFAATMALPEGALRMLVHALSGPLETQGQRLTRGYLMLWEDPATGRQMQVLARSALSNEAASARMQALLTGALAGPDIAALLAGRRTGFTLAVTQLLGVAMARYVIGLPQLAELDFEDLVARTAPVVHLHLTTPDD